MPRNSSGTYTLPAGNPVVPNTLIETTWANPTMSDIGAALSDSLDRYGRGGMLAQLKLADGTVAQPAFAFNSESSTGLYRPGAGILNVAVLGAVIASFAAAAVTFTEPLVYAADPAGPNELTRKSYVDAAIAAGGPYLPLIGGTLAGPGNLRVDGKLSMGTASTANALLEIVGNAPATAELLLRSSAGVAAGQGVSVVQGGNDAYVYNRHPSGLMFLGTANTARVTITAAGDVGIGATPSGGNRFTVSGAAGATSLVGSNGAVNAFFNGGAGTTESIFGTTSNHALVAYTNSAERMRIATTGHIFVNNVQGLGITSTFFHQVAGSYLAYGDGLGFRALNSTATGAAAFYVNAGAAGGGKLSGEGGPLQFETGSAIRMTVTAAGIIQDGTGNELGFKGVPVAATGGGTSNRGARGQCYSSTGALTFATGTGNDWLASDVVSVYNNSAAAISLIQGAGITIRLAGTTTTGTRTLAPRGLCTGLFVTATELVFSGSGLS